MNKLTILPLLLIAPFPAAALAEGTFYLEMGGFYSQDRIWYFDENGDSLSESGIAGHLAAGYELSFDEKLIFNAQVRHGSDLKKSGDRDITSHEEIGIMVRLNVF